MADWFVDPTETVRLGLDLPTPTAGEQPWILVKRELSFAEEATLSGAMIGRFTPTAAPAEGEKRSGRRAKGSDAETGIAMDFKKYEVERLATWIVEWSATGPDGKMLPVTRDAIEALRPAIAAAITRALDAHIEGNEVGKDPPSGESPR